jgi:hypothetical protein
VVDQAPWQLLGGILVDEPQGLRDPTRSGGGHLDVTGTGECESDGAGLVAAAH